MSLLKYDREDVGKLDVNKLKPIMDHIPDKKLRENIMIGDKEELTNKIKQYIDIGCEYFIFEIVNGASSKNAPFTYWDVAKNLSDIIPEFS
jgi:hypothetical protein